MPRKRSLVMSLVLAGAVAACSTPSGGPGPSGPAASSAPPGSSGPPSGPPPSPLTPPPADPADPWLLTADGIGPYRLGQRVDSMPAAIFGESDPVDAAKCPELYVGAATGIYAGTLLLTVRHNVLVEISTGGGEPGVHTAEGDEIGTPWPTVETRHGPSTEAPGTWRTNPSGQRAFVVPYGDRVVMFGINPIRPRSVGAITAGLADHTGRTFEKNVLC
jgi:hypothetical protein